MCVPGLDKQKGGEATPTFVTLVGLKKHNKTTTILTTLGTLLVCGSTIYRLDGLHWRVGALIDMTINPTVSVEARRAAFNVVKFA